MPLRYLFGTLCIILCALVFPHPIYRIADIEMIGLLGALSFVFAVLAWHTLSK